jgi:hypothetical protein
MAMIDGFYHLSASWYGEANLRATEYIDDVTFGWFDEEDGSVHRDYAELSMRWYDLGGVPTPRLEIFSDGFRTLSMYSEILAELQNFGRITPEQFCIFLKDFGFKDLTKRERNF